MWKLLLGFVVFAAIAIFVLMKSGGNVDMSGEKHGVDATHTDSPASEASAPIGAASAASH
ncbi:MAG: hypothetical protein ACM3VZ_00685 [Acidobacteriota bacterium]